MNTYDHHCHQVFIVFQVKAENPKTDSIMGHKEQLT